MIGGVINRILGLAGFRIDRISPAVAPVRLLRDVGPEINEVITRVSPFTMTFPERIAAVCESVSHLVKHGIAGDLVECGVWKGGSIMAAILTLIRLGDVDRKVYLYDTYEGMTSPGQNDVAPNGIHAGVFGDVAGGWCFSPLEEVQRNINSTGYPPEKINFIKGKVEETIPGVMPEKIALLRLDTDWYESTRHELVHLFPLIVDGGIIIIDDYGYWQGCRKAVDEYFAENHIEILLHRIDATGRTGIVRVRK